MEETTVLIVGAGPSGLALAVSLGRMGIKTVVLEKDLEVSEDPRGIAIAGDAVRVSYQLGIGNALVSKIGSDTGKLCFHNQNFRNHPFMSFDTSNDYLQQSVSNAINQFQPDYERALRTVIVSLPLCDLRIGCEVVNRVEEDSSIVIEYLDRNGKKTSIRASWLVGADGKRGVVRKRFLEPEGIKQGLGLYNHVSTWVAANFNITLPSPQTHPEFPLWKLGYSPEDVYSLFWPPGMHLCNDVKRPSVSGSFGPRGSRFWRHEYSVEPEDTINDAQDHLWSQFGSWLEIPGSQISNTLSGATISYPRDCVKITRCRPFTFATKVVNRWFVRRTLLIGDAAHVFPPFGGQGIASGIRDAQALSWRLAFLSRIPAETAVREKFLTGWANERRQVCDHAMKFTKLNGSITTQRNPVAAVFFRIFMRLLWRLPAVVKIFTKSAMGDTFHYSDCDGLFALNDKGGGWKLPQIWVRNGDGKPELSDSIFIRDMSRLALLIVIRGAEGDNEADVAEILREVDLPGRILTQDSVKFLHVDNKGAAPKDPSLQHYYPCSRPELLAFDIKPINGYDEKTLEKRIGKRAKYIILRPDFYIHSVASSKAMLLQNVQKIAKYFE